MIRSAMVRSTWQNNFMIGIIFLAVVFVLCAGWIIFNHYNESPITESSPLSQPLQTQKISNNPSHTIPNQFSPEFVKQMENRIDATNSSDHKEVSTKNFSHEFENGFQWASNNHVKNFSQCSGQTKDSLEGCRTYVEINNYISRIQVIPNFKTSE